MQTIELTWQGRQYEIKAEFDLYWRIEQKVAINRIAEAFDKAASGGVADVPFSHVAWVVYCCLRHVGVEVRSPIEVQHALFGDEMPDYGPALRQLLVAYYGAAPERPAKKAQGGRDSKSSPRSGKT